VSIFRVSVFLAAVFACASLPSCKDHDSSDNIVEVPKDSPEIALATARAKQNWPQFVAAFKNPAGKGAFIVKTGFPIKTGGNEHMWIYVRSLEGNQIKGTLVDQPRGDIGHKEGDTITITVDQLEDWAFFEGQAMVGGFSVEYTNKLEKEQKDK
jgi:uncharacterized protein YegJ (DUF2314 family)